MAKYRQIAQTILDEADKKSPPYKKVGRVHGKPFEVAVGRKSEIWLPRMKSTTIEKEIDVQLSVSDLLKTSAEYRHIAEVVERMLIETAQEQQVIRKEVFILDAPTNEESMFYGLLPKILYDQQSIDSKLTVTNGQGRSYVFSKGLGVRKTLLKMAFMLDMDLTIFELMVDDLLQIKSKYTQRASIKGTLVLSINPIDFLTMSMNNSGWRSCYHLNGDRPIGATALMQSPYAAIAYLKTENEYNLGEYSGPNKMWRTVVIFDGMHGYIGKHYPFYSADIEDELWQMIQSIIPEVSYLRNTQIRSESPFIFDDVQNGYLPTTVFGRYESLEPVTLNMVRTVHCLKCGERMNKYEESLPEYGLVTCMECSNTSYCYECYDYKYGQGVGIDTCRDCSEDYEEEEED